MTKNRTDFYVVVPLPVTELGAYTTLVYCVLRDYADQRTGEAFPSHQTIATRAGMSKWRVRKSLEELRDAGWITWTERVSSDGSQTSHRYTIHGSAQRSKTTHPAGSKRAGGSASGKGGSASNSREVVRQTARGSASDSNELLPNELLPNRTNVRRSTSDVSNVETVVNLRTEQARLAELLANLIEANGSRRPIVSEGWLATLERMHRIDGVSWPDIEGAIRWAQADEFWQANILSPTKLRAKYDQLRLQAQRKKAPRGRDAAWDDFAAYVPQGVFK